MWNLPPSSKHSGLRLQIKSLRPNPNESRLTYQQCVQYRLMIVIMVTNLSGPWRDFHYILYLPPLLYKKKSVNVDISKNKSILNLNKNIVPILNSGTVATLSTTVNWRASPDSFDSWAVKISWRPPVKRRSVLNLNKEIDSDAIWNCHIGFRRVTLRSVAFSSTIIIVSKYWFYLHSSPCLWGLCY